MIMTTKKENPLAKKDEKKGSKAPLKTPLEIVVMGEAAKRFKSNMWVGLVHQAALSVNINIALNYAARRKAFEDLMLEGEEKYMEKYHAKNGDARNAKGEWKYRTYLPASYRTAKSVACNCIEQNVTMLQDGEVVGKTACEEAYKVRAGTVSPQVAPKTVKEKWDIALNTVDKLMLQMTDVEYVQAQSSLTLRGKGVRKIED
jgi:hypothetical protein